MLTEEGVFFGKELKREFDRRRIYIKQFREL
jgi:hypothetical protein